MLSFIGVPPGTSWRPFLRVVAVAALWAGVLVLVGLALSVPTPTAAGRVVLDTLESLQTDRLTAVVRRISALGNVWVVGAGAVVLAVALHLRRSPLARELRLLLFGTFGGALVITAPLKLLTARARPSGALVGTLSSAYPSGHALRTAAVYGLLVWLITHVVRSRARRRAAVAAVLVLMVAIAFARVYLWVHWPSDVVVGLTLGGIWLGLLLRVTRPLRPVTALDEAATGPRVTDR
jgi:undecaprenyl-diphosphatase